MKRSDKPVYAPIPARAIGDEKLSALDFRVLAALAAHDRLGANGIGCYASHPRLAALVRCHEKSLSRSLATLAGADDRPRYIEAGRHPLNARLRVYKVIYTAFDKGYLTAGLGNEAATSARRSKGNDPATENPAIGNQTAPQQVTEPNGVSDNNQSLSVVNIFSETGTYPVETGNTSGETAPTNRENDRNVGAIERPQGFGKKASSASVAAMLAMIERGIKAGKIGNNPTWLRFLEETVADLNPPDQNYGRAMRLLEEFGDKVEGNAA